jgi:hypothetical protein
LTTIIRVIIKRPVKVSPSIVGNSTLSKSSEPGFVVFNEVRIDNINIAAYIGRNILDVDLNSYFRSLLNI